MGGQAGVRGYLIQALIAVLNSLNKKDKWISVSVEPNDESEKVDICWKYEDSKVKVVQVKSTENSFSYAHAKKWSEELESKTPNATEYILFLVGRLENKLFEKKDAPIGKTIVKNIDLDINALNAQIIIEIDTFFEDRGKKQLPLSIKRIITKSLNYDFTEHSIFGREMLREEFDKMLLNYLIHIEEYLCRNLYTPLLQPMEPTKDLGDKYNLTKNILKLIGWNNLNENEIVTVYDSKTNKDESYTVDFYASYDSRLKDNECDKIFINSYFNAEYPFNPQYVITENAFAVDLLNEKISKQNNHNIKVSTHALQFFLSLKESESNSNYISEIRNLYKTNILNDNIIYYAIDNRHLNFLISSIIAARTYRDSEKLVVKFLYPITEDVSTEGKIGKRDVFLPPQYINSSILPIVKESHDKISVLLFCADKYSRDRLRKLIWLVIRLTSGFANEYKIYFPDYSDIYTNEVAEVIRSYKNDELLRKVEICSLGILESTQLKDIPLVGDDSDLIDQEFDRKIEQKKIVKINPHLVEFLPYGDSIKPFLDSEFVDSQDLKVFLARKGIFIKGSNKKKIIHLMTSLLFSPAEIEDLIELVNVKDKPLKGTDKSYSLLTSHTIPEIMNNNLFQFSNIGDGIGATILSDIEFKPSKSDPNIFVWESHIDQENPTKQAIVSHSISMARVIVKKEGNALVLDKEYNSKPARIIADRVAKKIAEKLIGNNIIEEDVKEVLFSDFKNRERANFLLSFTNVEDTDTFSEPTTRSVLYAFDETQELPEEYKDKVGKEYSQRNYGKNLEGIKEITEESFKAIILLEEINISYKFNWLGIYGYYNVKLNFSSALRNKPIPNGSFQFQSTVNVGRKSKDRVSSMQVLEQELKKEFSKMRLNRYKKFNKI